MAAEAPPRLLVLLLVWPCLFFVGSLASGAPAADLLHPVVLLPGYSCSQLDARLTHEFDPSTAPSCGARFKGKGWFRLWENHTALQENPALVPCYAELLRLVYDPVAGDYRNVKTRVVPFRAKRAFGSDDPATKDICLGKLIQALESVGYREGKNLFGAPYDFQYAAAAPGQASRGFSRFLSDLRMLVEQASERNGDMPVIFLTHSFGGLNANVFLGPKNATAPAGPWFRQCHDRDFGGDPQVVYGDGDGAIKIASILALGTVIGAQPEQDYFKSIMIHNTSHRGTISDDFALTRVVNEVLDANGNSMNTVNRKQQCSKKQGKLLS